MKITKKLSQKVEDTLKALGYKVIYEKGNFQSGYCMLENQQIIVVNKFFTFESRVNTLVDVLCTIEMDESLLDEEQIKFVAQLKKENAQLEIAA